MRCDTIEITIDSNGNLSANHSKDNQKGEVIELKDAETKIKVGDEKVVEVLINILKENRLRGTSEYGMLGSLLYNTLLDNEVGREIYDLIVDVKVEKIKLELRFNGVNNSFAHWPWEYLFCPEGQFGNNAGFFMSTHPKIIISRPVNVDMEELTERLRVLLVAPGPSASGTMEQIDRRKKIYKLPLLAYERLFEDITTILTENKNIEIHSMVAKDVDIAGEGNVPILTFANFSGSVASINPHIIHFLGHGRMFRQSENGEALGQVAFTTEDGRVDWVSEQRFADAIKVAKPKFVFLHACETAALAPYRAISGVARQLTGKDGLPAMVAMQCKINQDSAFDFAKSFYKELSNTGIIDDAVQAGRKVIVEAKRQIQDSDEAENDFAFGIPVLYVKGRKPLFTVRKDAGKSDGQEKGGPTNMKSIICLGGCNQLLPITVKFCNCKKDCGEFVDRPVPDCMKEECPQKLFKWQKKCGMCGADNIHFEQA